MHAERREAFVRARKTVLTNNIFSTSCGEAQLPLAHPLQLCLHCCRWNRTPFLHSCGIPLRMRPPHPSGVGCCARARACLLFIFPRIISHFSTLSYFSSVRCARRAMSSASRHVAAPLLPTHSSRQDVRFWVALLAEGKYMLPSYIPPSFFPFHTLEFCVSSSSKMRETSDYISYYCSTAKQTAHLFHTL